MQIEKENWERGAKQSTHRDLLPLPDAVHIIQSRNALNRIIIPALPSIREAAINAEVMGQKPNKVVVLGPGSGEELVHLRTMYPDSQITGFEIIPPLQFIKSKSPLLPIADFYNIRLLTGKDGDYSEIERCIDVVNGLTEGDIIVSRAPRVLITINHRGEVTYDDQIATTIASWITYAATNGVKVFMTFYSRQEVEKVQAALRKFSIDSHYIKLRELNKDLTIKHRNKQGKVILTGHPDLYTLKLGEKS